MIIWRFTLQEFMRPKGTFIILYICVLAKNIPSLLSGNYCFWVAFVTDIIRAMNQMCVYPGDGDGDGDDDGETSVKQLDGDPQLHEVR